MNPLSMVNWNMLSFQDSNSPVMQELMYFHDYTMTIMVVIVMMILVNIILTSGLKLNNSFYINNHTIELVWTLLPIMVLFFIAIPSLKMLYITDDPFFVNLTVKTTGHQWYWTYEYSEFPYIEMDSFMVSSSMNRLLDTDNSLVLPTNTNVRMIVSASDVIHSWTVPSMGIKVDAIPGRLNQIFMKSSRSGLMFGQCSEICGANHSFMPIKLEMIPMKDFCKWINGIVSL